MERRLQTHVSRENVFRGDKRHRNAVPRISCRGWGLNWTELTLSWGDEPPEIRDLNFMLLNSKRQRLSKCHVPFCA